MSSSNNYECSLCNYSAPSRSLWLSHIRGVHHDDDNFFITCGIEECTKTYTKCMSFVSHVYRHHRSAIVGNNSKPKPHGNDDSGASVSDVQQDVLQYYYDNGEEQTSLQHAIDQVLKRDQYVQQRKGALFILNLKEIRFLSESAVDHVVKETQKVFEHTIGRVRAGVNECIAKSGTDPSSVVLEPFWNSVEQPFKDLHSTYLQEKFYRENLGCIEPTTVKVGPAYYVTQFSGNKRKKVLRTDTFQYIPVEDTLKQLLEVPDILHEIDNVHGSTDETLTDMCDGSVFKTHPVFSQDIHAIQLIAYFDEVELCNPLGSNTKKHKLGCIFFSIGNFRQRFRSQLKCIFVAAVCSNLVIQKHGINSFLKPFVQSLLTLSTQGLTVTVGSIQRNFKVGLLAFLADTLAAHALGGFKESMSFAHRICRSCMATTEQIQHDFIENSFELRTREKHQSHLEQLSESYSSNSVKYGINHQSELDQIPHFSVAEQLPHDIMHDLFEGVIPYEMKLLLTHLVNAKFLTIATVNNRLRRFDFGYIEQSDVPSQLDDKNFMRNPEQKIRQSASKMWLLAITLPLLIGDLIPEDSKEWNLFILLLRICSICCSWRITPDTVSYLSILIEEHHSRFKVLYPEKAMIPKMHYMVHYPRQILKFGPLIYSWTMRHEGKLCVIKRAAIHGNFKNISYTVAKRSQHALCYHLNCGQPFLSNYLEVSKNCSEVPFTEEVDDLKAYVSNFCSPDALSHPKWIKFDYLYIKKFACVYLGKGSLYPAFGQVIDICTFPGLETKPEHILRIQHFETLILVHMQFSCYPHSLLCH